MKNILVALALFAAVGATAQTKKTTVAKATVVEVAKLSPEAAADRDMKALTALVQVDESVKGEINKIFITKYRTKEETTLSAERITALSSYVESQLATYIGDANFAKLKTNKKLYNQLVK